MVRSILLALVVLFALGGGALAQSLDEMRSSGAVGERYDGLLEAREQSAEPFVARVNAERLKIYADAAQKQGVSVDDVGKVYAKEIMKKAPAGTWFLGPDGSWRR
ncbi:MAG: hypothetical protein TEF_20295 [Rhizobiales bacterium NRL2]|jgi:hypothetical protein|nr:MAG: hypothetical protein TEF_20295 [Rhizobiales bacterium NRL2]